MRAQFCCCCCLLPHLEPTRFIHTKWQWDTKNERTIATEEYEFMEIKDFFFFKWNFFFLLLWHIHQLNTYKRSGNFRDEPKKKKQQNLAAGWCCYCTFILKSSVPNFGRREKNTFTYIQSCFTLLMRSNVFAYQIMSDIYIETGIFQCFFSFFFHFYFVPEYQT